jgi:hypothetical protein
MARSAYKRGQIAWLVCGWKEPPLNEDGESDWDKTSDFQYVCHSRESAEAKAKQLAPIRPTAIAPSKRLDETTKTSSTRMMACCLGYRLVKRSRFTLKKRSSHPLIPNA